MSLIFYSILKRPPKGFVIYRNLNTEVSRVRFAPSPTGYLHLGGLRTALYNYLFANSKKGVFILRIEDTDQTRKVEGSVEALVRDLEWVGIKYHEGPGKGGQFGPYIQSERLHLYQQHIEKLLNNGMAYYCFCTERRLNLIRREALKMRQNPKYDNRCRNLTQYEVNEKFSAGKSYCVRFKLTSDCQVFEDLISGNVAFDVSLNEGDPVIMKSDGFPTYHFANVVDDHLMGITHVLRGVEWQISTTKHLLLYNYQNCCKEASGVNLATMKATYLPHSNNQFFLRAFQWTPPHFGHLPLIVNSDGTKLSKRQSDVKVEDYRNRGIYPLALVNYMSLAGGGFDHVRGEGIRLKTIDELAQQFKIENVSSHPSRLNPDLLEECNRLDMKRQLQVDDKDLIHQLKTLILNKYAHLNLNIEEEYIRNVLHWATSRITRLEELVSPKFAFLWILPKEQEVDTDLIQNLINKLEDLKSFEQSFLTRFLKEFSADNNITYPKLMQVLRSVLSGFNEGPKVVEMMEIFGREQSLIRLKAVLR